LVVYLISQRADYIVVAAESRNTSEQGEGWMMMPARSLLSGTKCYFFRQDSHSSEFTGGSRGMLRTSHAPRTANQRNVMLSACRSLGVIARCDGFTRSLDKISNQARKKMMVGS
jgi:hypothetical protein